MRKLTLKTLSVAKSIRQNFKKFRSTPDLKLSWNVGKRAERSYVYSRQPRLLLMPAPVENTPVLDISNTHVSAVQEKNAAGATIIERIGEGPPSKVPCIQEPVADLLRA
jgi:hypothetical protein